MKDKFADKGEKKPRAVVKSRADPKRQIAERTIESPRRHAEKDEITEMTDDFPSYAEEIRRSFDAHVEDFFARIGDDISDRRGTLRRLFPALKRKVRKEDEQSEIDKTGNDRIKALFHISIISFFRRK